MFEKLMETDVSFNYLFNHVPKFIFLIYLNIINYYFNPSHPVIIITKLGLQIWVTIDPVLFVIW